MEVPGGLLCCEVEKIRRSYRDPVLLNDRVLNNLLCSEEKYTLSSDYFTIIQTDLKPYMRKMVADWMLEVCEEQQCEQDVFPLAMNYMDRFLAVCRLNRNKLQLLGATCMFLASKLKETSPLTAEKLIIYTDKSISYQQLLEIEVLILKKLKWDLSAITPHDFLEQVLHRLPIEADYAHLIRKHAQTLIAMCVTDYSFAMYPPSMIAAGCVGAAVNGLSSGIRRCDEIPNLMNRLYEITKIELEYLHQCQEQIEHLLSKNLSSGSQQEEMLKEDKEAPSTPTDIQEISLLLNTGST
ncbi:G1/S-specific cyclin-D2-like [Antedon mediterranea]|uniref:G1/S-specific cyclin-D2-like n=1 Tax=Antedon mediterranea TaxID=105859 RepID=UPI003AF62702